MDTSSGTLSGSTATYTCDTGYTLSGSQSRTCGEDGNWTASEPLCNGKHAYSLIHCVRPILLNSVVIVNAINTGAPNGTGYITIIGIVGGVIPAVLIIISMVIFALLIGYIIHLRRRLKQQLNKE